MTRLQNIAARAEKPFLRLHLRAGPAVAVSTLVQALPNQ
jgi:hypothetical protein